MDGPEISQRLRRSEANPSLKRFYQKKPQSLTGFPKAKRLLKMSWKNLFLRGQVRKLAKNQVHNLECTLRQNLENVTLFKKSNSPHDMCLFISPLCPKRFSQRSHLKGFIPS